jgi:predicted O-methyltransferase YrrM
VSPWIEVCANMNRQSQLSVSCPLLQRILETGKVQDGEGKDVEAGGAITPDLAVTLNAAVKRFRPKTALEVGMANGVSSLSILSALDEVGGEGRLISFDPNQTAHWHGVGILNVRRAGFGARHMLREQMDYLALPALLAEGQRIQFAYIDGWHTFDYTLLDFFYVDKMLDVGGVVAFNDCGYRAVNRVLHFVRTHRRYKPVDVGLARNFGRSWRSQLGRRLANISHEDRYFQKVEQFEPAWNFYARF